MWDEQPETETQDSQPRPPGGFSAYDVATVVFLGLTILVCVGTGVIAVNPDAPFNPFKPAPTVTLFHLPTPEPTNTPITPTPTPTITKSPTPAPTASPTPTRTPVVQPTEVITTPRPTTTPTGLPVTRSPYPFTVAGDSVSYIPNPNDEGCNWMSIAGQVVDMWGAPIEGLLVHLTGEGIDQYAVTGEAPLYGAGGYELFINNVPLAGEYRVQLTGPTGAALSEPVVVVTIDDCEHNVAIVNFIQNHEY